MAEYIEREALTAFLEENHDDGEWLVNQYNADWICSWIESQPAADVEPVKHGKWVNERELAGGFRSIWGYDCSVCGHTVENYPTNYCPNCGARMDGE